MIRALIEITLRESLNRRGGMILLGTAAVLAPFFAFSERYAMEEGRQVVYALGNPKPMDALVWSVSTLVWEVQILAVVALLVTIFVVAGLLTSPHECGYIELLLSKPLSRAKLLLGRYCGVLALALLPVALMALLPFAVYRWHVAFPVSPFFRGLALLALLYACVIAVMQLIAVLQPNTGLLVLSTFGLYFLSGVLHSRHLTLIAVSDTLPNRFADSLYYLFPKFSEMSDLAPNLVITTPVESWMPVWSTALFSAACLAVAVVLFSRRSH